MDTKRIDTQMNTDDLLALYVREVTDQLPRPQRADVGLELRALLREELATRARQRGQSPDGALTLAFLRDFGHPREVATRYHAPWALVAPADTRRLLTAALVGSATLGGVALATLETVDGSGLVVAMLAWLGALVVVFGIKGWAVRRWPHRYPWVPRDRDRVSRTGGVLLIALIALAIVTYGAPSWVFARLTGGGVLSSWLGYDPVFAAQRLPWLLALWVGQGVLLGVVTARGRWSRRLRRVGMVLGLAVAAVLAWFARAGSVFAHATPDQAAKVVLGLAIVVILVDVVLKLRRDLGGAASEAA